MATAKGIRPRFLRRSTFFHQAFLLTQFSKISPGRTADVREAIRPHDPVEGLLERRPEFL